MLWLLLGPPLLWFLMFYLVPLAALLGQSLLTFDEFSMTVRNEFTLANLHALFTDAALADILLRTFATAVVVTVCCGGLTTLPVFTICWSRPGCGMIAKSGALPPLTRTGSWDSKSLEPS